MLNIFKKHKKNKAIEEKLNNLNDYVRIQKNQLAYVKTYTKYNDGYKHGTIDILNIIQIEIEKILDEV